jgi:hypothetical protein
MDPFAAAHSGVLRPLLAIPGWVDAARTVDPSGPAGIQYESPGSTVTSDRRAVNTATVHPGTAPTRQTFAGSIGQERATGRIG